MNVLILDLYSREQVGYYSLAFRIAILPLTLFSGSLSEVFFQKASASYRRNGTFWNELRFNIVVSACLSLFIFGPLGLLARPIFAFALGARWVPAADMLVLLLPMLLVRFVSATIQTAPLVVGRVSFLLFQHLGLLAVILAAYAAAKAWSLDIDQYLLLGATMMAGVYLAYVVSIAATTRHKYRKPGTRMPGAVAIPPDAVESGLQ
jgi:O-antigen/teichoic acid export membrane protein